VNSRPAEHYKKYKHVSVKGTLLGRLTITAATRGHFLLTNSTKFCGQLRLKTKSGLYILRVTYWQDVRIHVGPKKQAANFCPHLRQILTDFDFFQRHILWKICYKVLTKYTTTPQCVFAAYFLGATLYAEVPYVRAWHDTIRSIAVA